MNNLLKSVVIVAALKATQAQIETDGQPMSLSVEALSSLEVVDLSAQAPDVAQLLQDDRNTSNLKGPYRVGVVMPVNASLNDFTNDAVARGNLYRFSITSPNALGMGVNFAKFHLPEGATLHAYNGDSTTVRGAFTSANHKHYGGFAITPVPGDTLVLEVFAPHGTKQPAIELESVVHHYKNTAVKRAGEPTVVQGEAPGTKCFGCSGSCNVNMVCEAGTGWEDQASGVTRLLTASGGSLCTGSFINNVEEDGRQLFLSANHCGGGNADGWILMFNFQTATCANGATPPSRDQTVQGTRLLARNGLEDFVLLDIVEPVPASYNAYMTGFDASDVFSFEKPYSISHPSGDVKKLGTFGGTAVPEGYFQPGDSHWFVAAWDEGMTEGGSSGSALYDDMKRIRGQLHGGRASCSFPFEDYYGRISESWEASTVPSAQLKVHLDPNDSGVRVVDGQFLNVLRTKNQK